MPALLALIPSRVYEYGAIILVLSLGFGWYTLHERHKGAAEVTAADARTAAVAVAKDKAIEAAAQAASNSIASTYEKAVTAPVVPSLGVVCVAPRSRSVPKAPDNRPGTTEAAPVVGSGPTFDPTGPALTVGRDDDALILALQQQIETLVAAMNGQAK